MRFTRQSDGALVMLETASPLGKGGEAKVYKVVDKSTLCAKIYHHPSTDQANKIEVMLANPPSDPMVSEGHISISWPQDLLKYRREDERFAGFTMPRAVAMKPLFYVYNPVTRRQECPLFNYLYLHRAARNLAAAVQAVHTRGYVVGDLNESNTLVSETALITLVDCDSFQVRDTARHITYRCPVGKPDYTPHELQNTNFRLIDRQPESDYFGLAVLIFMLLMEGTHPYSGIFTGSEDPPPYEERILKGFYTYGSAPTPFTPMPFAPPLFILEPDIQELFTRCFVDGYSSPSRRPNCSEWVTALKNAENNLINCSLSKHHLYGKHLSSCPWCERKEKLGGRDPFPSEPQEPIVRRRVVQPQQPGPAPGSRPLPYRIVGGSGTASVSTINKPASPQANWPLAPTAVSASSPPSSVVIPDYSPYTWFAGSCALISIILPGFQMTFAALAIICGLAATRQKMKGLWLALSSIAVGVVVFSWLGVLKIAAYEMKTDERTIVEQGPIDALAFSPGSKMIAVATARTQDQRLIPGEISVYNTRTGDPVHFMDGVDDESSVAFSHTGLIASGSGASMMAGSLKLWDDRHFNLLADFQGFHGDITGLAFSHSGKEIVTGTRTGHVSIWTVPSLTRKLQWNAGGQVFSVDISKDGDMVAVGSGSVGTGEPGEVAVYSAASGKLLWRHPAHGARATSVVFSSDGDEVASAGNDNSVRIWNARTGHQIAILNSQKATALGSVAFSHNGTMVACGGDDGEVRLWDVAAGRIVGRYFIKNAINGMDTMIQKVSISDNDHFIAGGTVGGSVHLWRLKLDKKVGTGG